MIPESFIQKVKDLNDIQDVIGQFVRLEKKGKNAWACCPFHSEKTPSFAINLDTQTYKCFGCGERGNVVSFIMKYQHLTFPEAVEYLAKRVNLEVPQSDDPREREKRQRRDKLLACLKTAAKYYFETMNGEAGKPFLSYWYGRGLTPETIVYFGLGASVSFDGVIRRLEAKGFDPSTILASGIAEEKNGRLIDAEHHRAIVPIIDARGSVVAFGGRILEAKGFAKYKNTPATEVFFKSQVLYNLNRFREQNTREAILVEGYMDVIALYQANFKNAVAPMGTSFTDEQCAALRRVADTVYVSFDGDGAGRKATLAAIDKLRKQNFEIRIVTEPDELDPDEVIKKYGAEGYRKCLDEALPWVDYRLKVIGDASDLASPDGRSRYAKAAAAFLAELDVVTREIYLDKVAQKANVPRAAMSAYFKENPPEPKRAEPVREEKTDENPTASAAERKRIQGLADAERFILGAFLRIGNYQDLGTIPIEYFSDEKRKKVFAYILARRDAIETPREDDVYDLLEYDDEAKKIFDAFEAIPAGKVAEHFTGCAVRLKNEWKQKKIRELLDAFRDSKSPDEQKAIVEAIDRLKKDKSEDTTEERE